MIHSGNGSMICNALPKTGSRSVRLGGSVLSPNCHSHICAFFTSPEEEYRILLPFIKEGLAGGEKAFHTINPQRREDHLQHLAASLHTNGSNPIGERLQI